MSNEKKYHSSVSIDTQTKIESVCDMVADFKLFTDNRMLDTCEINREFIEFKSSDGFISHNKGGVVLSMFVSQSIDSSTHITKPQGKFIASLNKMLYDDFLSDNPDLKNTDYWNTDIFQRYECEFWEDGSDMALMEFRCVIDDADKITIDLSICYSDAPYYRGACFELIGSLKLNQSQFERITLEFIKNYFYRAISRA